MMMKDFFDNFPFFPRQKTRFLSQGTVASVLQKFEGSGYEFCVLL